MKSAPPQLNNTARILLGMIAEGHTTGYSIKSEIERSTRFYWGASLGGIYPELRRLEEGGLLTREDDNRGGARRHAYRLTTAGRDALHGWLTHPRETPVEMRNESLLKLRFAGVLSTAERCELIARMRLQHHDRAEAWRQRLDEEEFDDPLHRLAIEYAHDWNRWACEWCDRTLAAFRAKDRPE